MRLWYIAALLGSVSLAACSSDKKAEPVTAQSELKKASDLFAQAQQSFDKKEYKSAAKDAEEVTRLYPYAKEAAPAAFLMVQSYYKNTDYELAIGAAKKFLELYPANAKAVQVQTMLANSYYDRLPDVNRDQTIAQQAEQAFRVIMTRYPNTPDAEDAKARLQNVREHMAGNDMAVGRYYLQRRLPAPALMRFKDVVARYQDTVHVQEALYRIVEAALILGVPSEAKRAAAILGANYPDTTWYKEAYTLLKNNDVS